MSDVAPRYRLLLLLVFLLALLPRLHGAFTVGWGWDGPGTFNLVNFDEGGACRAALGGFDYPAFVGRQTLALAALAGVVPAAGTAGDPARAKAFCHSPPHLLVARGWSALLGALTAPVLVLIGWQLRPDAPPVGLVAGALLAVSGFHTAESFSGTVDAASVFFIYLFLALLVAAARGGRLALLASPLFLAAAVATKYWLFAALGYAGLVGGRALAAVTCGFSPRRLVVTVLGAGLVFALATNSELPRPAGFLWLLPWYLLPPWRRMHPRLRVFWALVPPLAAGLAHWPLFAAWTTGALEGRFGTGYGAIGWHKLLRNPLDGLLVLLLGLGLPACLCLPAGLASLRGATAQARAWRVFLVPIVAFALYLAFLAPVTYYRHFLPLLPVAALLAACGLWRAGRRWRPWLLGGCLGWSALLGLDIVADYHRDPRIALRSWYAEARPERVFISFYVNPPPGAARHALFRPALAAGAQPGLATAEYLVLSENWYDTAFANELNGPLAGRPERLVKTTPERARFYRRALAGEDPRLERLRVFPVHNIMPELVLHKAFYGTFQLFVGDLVVFRIRGPEG
ncbi:hypothetical protein [Pseudohaliea rubra]|uniref:Glycosyltransferase RgtA/B/C/D-like domain-containing protein n=1 Tax=Pseudohaliea rubra DSM 19751 TaxID=1265313 RepID=A0A095VNX9_9GAMM|nr:hypothetical protein [Pseudohaliea rubra]KGE03070.1 hypothetical protein HRUBRA_02302 [Pseudohaliea rubra DSM 19751]